MKKTGGLLNEKISRRNLVAGGAAIAGSAAVSGFPMVWAQKLKDITLNHTGMSYSTLADIGKQAE
jgi:putative spermidine/putrescine transport system substrate-binding protein